MPTSHTEYDQLVIQIPAEHKGKRLDQALAALLPNYSRSRLQAWIKTGRITHNNLPLRAREKLLGGEEIVINPLPQAADPKVAAQPIPLQIVFEDEHLIVVNKQAGLVVHPAAGNWDQTLQNGLLYRFPELAALPRSGIVHRLDKDTTGLMVVARSLLAHKQLVDQLQSRQMKREYLALVQGTMVAGGSIEAAIGRHPKDRKRMAVTRQGKPALTHYRVMEKFRSHTLLRVQLETGRTHQIRVHMAHRRFPIVGDPVYAGRIRIPARSSTALIEQLRGFPRQALHATQLSLIHPSNGEWIRWEATTPTDMTSLIEALRSDTHVHRGTDS